MLTQCQVRRTWSCGSLCPFCACRGVAPRAVCQAWRSRYARVVTSHRDTPQVLVRGLNEPCFGQWSLTEAGERVGDTYESRPPGDCAEWSRWSMCAVKWSRRSTSGGEALILLVQVNERVRNSSSP